MARREYGDGSIYQRASDKRWIAAIDQGWTATGGRRRITVSARTRGEVVRKLRDKQRELEQFGDTGWDARTTVKQWVETYLERRLLPPKPLAPNGWKAAAQPLRKWVVTTIGHRRVADLTPGDIRKVAQAQYDAQSVRGGELKLATVDGTQRQLMTCLRHAKADGAPIADNVFLVPKPGTGKSDRLPLTIDETLRMLIQASVLDHGLRWAFALLYGARQGELLGLCELDPIDKHPLIDWDAGVIRLEWQLQKLNFNKPRSPASGFRIPRDYEAVPLEGPWHLVRPKSNAGYRILPIASSLEPALRAWLTRRPENKWGLVFPAADGRPANEIDDRQEWWALQETASVADPDLPPVRHPSGARPYHVHECRNTAATELDEAGATDNVALSLIGHSSIRTLRGYQKANIEPKRAVIEMISERMQLGAHFTPTGSGG